LPPHDTRLHAQTHRAARRTQSSTEHGSAAQQEEERGSGLPHAINLQSRLAPACAGLQTHRQHQAQTPCCPPMRTHTHTHTPPSLPGGRARGNLLLTSQPTPWGCPPHPTPHPHHTHSPQNHTHIPLPPHLAGVLIVTHSSAAEGWMPTQESNWVLVAPHFKAMPSPCMISAASGPTCRGKEESRNTGQYNSRGRGRCSRLRGVA
jgi:hypothetical protein